MNANTACILQVEDDEHDIYFLKYVFNKAGINNRVRIAKDGEQAIEYLSGIGPYADRTASPVPSLVLLDLNLPRKSGLEVLKWIREQPSLRTIVVVVLTSSSDPGDVRRSYELGANSFVVKSADLDERVEFANNLKAWWLHFNEFAPVFQAASMLPSGSSDCDLGVASPQRSLRVL